MVMPNGSEQAQPGQVTPPVTPVTAQFGTAPAPSTGASQADIDKAVQTAKSLQGRELAEKYRSKELNIVKAGGDDAATAAVMARQAQEVISEQNETVLLEAKAQVEEANKTYASAQELLSGIKADALVAQYGISKENLVALSQGNVQVMEQLAPMLPKAAATPAPVVPVVPGFVPDNNVGSGAGGVNVEGVTADSIAKMPYADLPAMQAALIAKAKGTTMMLRVVMGSTR